jgi:hypothetical protein
MDPGIQGTRRKATEALINTGEADLVNGRPALTSARSKKPFPPGLADYLAKLSPVPRSPAKKKQDEPRAAQVFPPSYANTEGRRHNGASADQSTGKGNAANSTSNRRHAPAPVPVHPGDVINSPSTSCACAFLRAPCLSG